MDKKQLRRQIIARRDQLTTEEIAEKSTLIAQNLYRLPEFEKAGVVMFFLNFGSEVQTIEMAKEARARGKIVLVPKMVPKTRELIASPLPEFEGDFEPGPFKIPEPKASSLRPFAPEKIDLVIVPGVAFDLRGNRLGYGGGYYDRFFALLKHGVVLAALVFDLQIVSQVPLEKWDRPVDLVVTENRIIRTP